MDTTYRSFPAARTPQGQPARADMTPNNAGGFGFTVDDWSRLDRFLVLGSEGGTYYVGEQTLTRENAEAVIRCIQADGKRVIERIVAISDGGLAAKNEPAIFALALAASLGSKETKALALRSVNKVCRIPTHIFSFAQYCQQHRGWGRGLRQCIRHWYNDRDADALAYQMVKYQSRNGWSNRDLLRLAHPMPHTPQHATLYRWIARGVTDETVPPIVAAFEQAKRAENSRQVARLIREAGLPRECVPTHFLDSAEVWEALLENMPIGALIRNLNKMTQVGLLAPMSQATAQVVYRLTDLDALRHGRIHPIALLSALATYKQGRGVKGRLTWQPVHEIVDALDAAFYLAFRATLGTGKRIMLALDVSGSMWGTPVAGLPSLACAEAAAAMALVTAANEQHYVVVPFDTTTYECSIGARQRLDDVLATIDSLGGGGTDCAAPIMAALREKWPLDAIIIYTDSETWSGSLHPFQAMREYRARMGLPTKLVVVAMAANHTTIRDPLDMLSMECVGFDASVPDVISAFVR